MKKHMESTVSRIAKMIKADIDNATGADEQEPVEHDIDISCFYDNGIAQEDFSENFKTLDDSDHYGHHLLAYGFDPDECDLDDVFEITDYGEFADYFGSEYDYHQYVDDIDAGTIAEKVIEVVPIEQLSSLFMEDFEGKNDFADWIEERSEEEENEGGGKYEWLMDLLPDAAAEAIENEAKLMVDFPPRAEMWNAVSDDEGGIELKDGWTSLYTTGYSKGDYAIVFGKSEDIGAAGMKKAIEHLLWDSPVYCRIEVDGEEYYVDSEMEDNYDYDKSEVIEIMKRLMGEKWDDSIEEYLEDNLPDQPEYSY